MEVVTGSGAAAGGHRPGQPEALLRPRLPAEPTAPGQVAAGPKDTSGPQIASGPAGYPAGIGSRPGSGDSLPLLPGFRELAARRSHGTAQRVIADLTTRRRSAGLSQTQVAARMGTSQSAVARLESGDADARVSTLARYAAAVGTQLSWSLHEHGTDPRPEEP